MTLNRSKKHFLYLPTPLEKLNNVSKDLGINLYIKRDDLTPIGGGGNKLRKLEYFIQDALDKNATFLLTVGGAQTNHGRLTAAVATKYGLKAAIVTADSYPGKITANLLLDGFMDCPVYFRPNKSLPNSVADIKRELEENGERVYFIPMGGSNPLGMLGYYDCALELFQQLSSLELAQKTSGSKQKEIPVFTTVGSLGTYMGLKLAAMNEKLPLDIRGISVIPFPRGSAVQALAEYKAACHFFSDEPEFKLAYNPSMDDSLLKEFDIDERFCFGAYNNPVPEVRDAIYYMARREAMFLDPCYTGKTFNAILQMVKTGEINSNEDVVMIHTGGFPGNYTEHHRLEMERELLHLMKF